MENKQIKGNWSGSSSPRHVQTLVGMNHCVGIARREAAYHCLLTFASESDDLREDSVMKRLEAYSRCTMLLEEAMLSTNRSTISGARSGVFDRPVVHILKMLLAMVHTISSLGSHVQMVHDEADILREPLGEDTYSLLVNTCRDFEANERVARSSFVEMLQVGRMLLESSTSKHRKLFSPEEEERYAKAYDEYVNYYSGEECLWLRDGL